MALHHRTLQILKVVVPLSYIAGAVPVWWTFAGANPDGLANAGLVLYTLPIVVIGSYLLGGEFPYVPGSYYAAHAVYFSVSVAILGLLLFALLWGFQRLARPRAQSGAGTDPPATP
jgi:hypothetical protein